MIEVVSCRADIVNVWIPREELNVLRQACSHATNKFYALGLSDTAEVYASIQDDIEHAIKECNSQLS